MLGRDEFLKNAEEQLLKLINEGNLDKITNFFDKHKGKLSIPILDHAASKSASLGRVNIIKMLIDMNYASCSDTFLIRHAHVSALPYLFEKTFLHAFIEDEKFNVYSLLYMDIAKGNTERVRALLVLITGIFFKYDAGKNYSTRFKGNFLFRELNAIFQSTGSSNPIIDLLIKKEQTLLGILSDNKKYDFSALLEARNEALVSLYPARNSHYDDKDTYEEREQIFDSIDAAVIRYLEVVGHINEIDKNVINWYLNFAKNISNDNNDPLEHPSANAPSIVNEKLHERLNRLVAENNGAKLDEFLKQYKDRLTPGDLNYALTLALYCDYKEAFLPLLNLGRIGLNILQKGETFLHTARDDTDAVNLLIERGANPNIRSWLIDNNSADNNLTPLEHAVKHNMQKKVRALIPHCGKEHGQILMFAILYGTADMIRVLLEFPSITPTINHIVAVIDSKNADAVRVLLRLFRPNEDNLKTLQEVAKQSGSAQIQMLAKIASFIGQKTRIPENFLAARNTAMSHIEAKSNQQIITAMDTLDYILLQLMELCLSHNSDASKAETILNGFYNELAGINSPEQIAPFINKIRTTLLAAYVEPQVSSGKTKLFSFIMKSFSGELATILSQANKYLVANTSKLSSIPTREISDQEKRFRSLSEKIVHPKLFNDRKQIVDFFAAQEQQTNDNNNQNDFRDIFRDLDAVALQLLESIATYDPLFNSTRQGQVKALLEAIGRAYAMVLQAITGNNIRDLLKAMIGMCSAARELMVMADKDNKAKSKAISKFATGLEKCLALPNAAIYLKLAGKSSEDAYDYYQKHVSFKKENDIEKIKEYFVSYGDYVTPDQMFDKLCTAAREGNLEDFKLLLRIGPPFDINMTNAKGETLLVRTVAHPEIVQYLLEKGANPNAQAPIGEDNNTSGSVLFNAIRSNCVETVKILISEGCDVNAQAGKLGYTPLHMVLEQPFQNEQILRLLVWHSKFQSVNIQDSSDFDKYMVDIANYEIELHNINKKIERPELFAARNKFLDFADNNPNSTLDFKALDNFGVKLIKVAAEFVNVYNQTRVTHANQLIESIQNFYKKCATSIEAANLTESQLAEHIEDLRTTVEMLVWAASVDNATHSLKDKSEFATKLELILRKFERKKVLPIDSLNSIAEEFRILVNKLYLPDKWHGVLASMTYPKTSSLIIKDTKGSSSLYTFFDKVTGDKNLRKTEALQILAHKIRNIFSELKAKPANTDEVLDENHPAFKMLRNAILDASQAIKNISNDLTKDDTVEALEQFLIKEMNYKPISNNTASAPGFSFHDEL